MAGSDIQKEIDDFMAKIDKSATGKTASGEAIVSEKKKKPGKPQPAKKGKAVEPTFADIGVQHFRISGIKMTPTVLLEKAIIPNYAKGMTPDLQILAKAFSETKWAGNVLAVGEYPDGTVIKKPMLQSCIELGVKLDEYGKSEDWEIIKLHLPSGKPDDEVIINPEEPQVNESDTGGTFLEELKKVLSVLDESMVGQAPEEAIVVWKDGDEWESAIMPIQDYEEFESAKEKYMELMTSEEPLQLQPGKVYESSPGDNLVLTKPVKVTSPGDMKEMVPPTFIDIPAGEFEITKVIWTVPVYIAADTEFNIVISYGVEKVQYMGTFKSVMSAPPFKLDKGGVLKVSILTTQPMEVWLELELKIIATEVDKSFKNFMETMKQEIYPPIPSSSTMQPQKLPGTAEKYMSQYQDEEPVEVEDKAAKKGYLPEVKDVTFGGITVNAQVLANAFRDHLEAGGFKFYTIPDSTHEYKKTKGVLMHYKISWAGDPELNLVKWAYSNLDGDEVHIHYAAGTTNNLIQVLCNIAKALHEGAGG